MKDDFTLRAGGASPIVISVCILILITITVLGNLSNWYMFHQFNIGAVVIPVAVALFFGGVFGLYFYIINIQIVDNSLRVYPGNKPLAFSWSSEQVNSNKAIVIKLDDVSGIFIGELRELKKLAENSEDKSLENASEYWHNTWIGTGSSFLPVLPAWFAAQFSIVMFVRGKDSHKSFIASLKPYSKKGVTKLMKLLKERGVPIVAQPSIGLSVNM